MGALTNLVKGAMTRVDAQSSSDNRLATIGLESSSGAIVALSKGGLKDARKMKSAVVALDGRSLDQQYTRAVGKNLGAVVANAERLKVLGPQISAAAKAWADGEKARTDALNNVSKATQSVATLNAETQANMFVGHSTANLKISVAQERHAVWGGL